MFLRVLLQAQFQNPKLARFSTCGDIRYWMVALSEEKCCRVGVSHWLQESCLMTECLSWSITHYMQGSAPYLVWHWY